MSVLGERLRTAREEKGISTSQAAADTHIREVIIRSLENGDYTGLPPRPFLQGLLKNYAAYLGLDPALAYDQYEIDTGVRPAPVAPPVGAIPETLKPRSDSPGFTREPSQVPDSIRPIEGWRSSLTDERELVSELPEYQEPGQIQQASPPRTAEAEAPIASGTDSSSLHIPPEAPSWSQRVGATRVPEAVAAIALVIALLGLGYFVYSRYIAAEPTRPLDGNIGMVLTTPSVTSIAAETSASTPIPTLEETAGIVIPPEPSATPTASPIPTTPVPSPTSNIPPNAKMTIQISANGPMDVWVTIDNAEAFRGTLENTTRSWTAHERLFIQVRNVIRGSVVFEGKRILPGVFEERTLLERAWQMNSQGIPLPVRAIPFLPTSTPTRTFTPSNTPTPSLTPTGTLTPTPTASDTPTVTNTPTVTDTPTATQSATPTLTTVPTDTPTLTLTPTETLTPSATPSPTLTNTPTSSATLAPTPTTVAGPNLASSASGARIVQYSSTYGGAWDAIHLIDGDRTFGWSSGPGQITNQFVIIELAGGGTYIVDQVRLNPSATGRDPATNNVRTFQILVSSTDSEARSFSPVVSDIVPQDSEFHTFGFAPIRARYVKLLAIDNYGGQYTEAAELEVYSSGAAPAATLTP